MSMEGAHEFEWKWMTIDFILKVNGRVITVYQFRCDALVHQDIVWCNTSLSIVVAPFPMGKSPQPHLRHKQCSRVRNENPPLNQAAPLVLHHFCTFTLSYTKFLCKKMVF